MKSLFLALALLVPSLASAGTITIKGSDTMVILSQRWAEEFMKKNPSIKVQVTGGGSGVGIAALINGTTEIADASRPMKDEEKAKLKGITKTDVTEIPVAKDGVTFYVNEKNPLSSLTPEQLRDIYLGDITNWKAVGGPDAPIVLYSRESSSGTYVFVKEHLLKNGDYAAAAQTLPGTAAVVNAVAREKNGIGYGGAAYGKGIKELKVKVGGQEVSPTLAEVQSGRYPLSRNLYFYMRQAPSGDVKTLVEWVLSPEGQKIADKVGYFPVK
jgi:phosphate transport system substrate-binding protein